MFPVVSSRETTQGDCLGQQADLFSLKTDLGIEWSHETVHLGSHPPYGRIQFCFGLLLQYLFSISSVYLQ